jgi:hypothetical protein
MEEHVKTAFRIFTVLVMLMITFVMASACQTIDGACWLPDSQGQGGGAGGPIIPTGVGGYGDTPTGGGGYGAGYVPCPSPQQEQLADWTCSLPGTAACVEQCAAKTGAFCPSMYVPSEVQYPYLKGTTGTLYRCTGCPCQYPAERLCFWGFFVDGKTWKCRAPSPILRPLLCE